MTSVITADDLLLAIAAILGVFAFLMLIRALFQSQRASRAAYYSTRRVGRDTANRTLFTAVTLALIAIGSLIASLLYPDQKPAAPPIIALSTTSMPVVLTVNIVPTTTATPLPATATSQATPTPLPTVPLARLATKTPTPSSDRNLTLRGISSQIDTLGLPISPTTEFTRGVKAIYVIFDYASVPNNTLLRHTWYRNGNSVHFDSLTWTRDGSGHAYVVWLPEGNIEEGLYEVRIMLGTVRQFSANFMVR